MLIASVIFNILLLVAVCFLVANCLEFRTERDCALRGWKKADDTINEVKDKVLTEHQLLVSPNGGEYGRLVIKKLDLLANK